MHRLAIAAAAAAAAALFTAAPSFAADMPMKAAPMAAPAFSWTGFYIGAQAGYGWARQERTTTGLTNGYDGRGGLGGIHGGYNWQFSNWVVGLEADYNWAGIRGDDNGVGGSLDETRIRGVGTVRARVGMTYHRLLTYVTGGWAYANIRHTNTLVATETTTHDRSGAVAGIGMEYAFLPNWSARVEYRYHWLGTYTVSAPTNGVVPYSVKTDLSTVTAGISYRF